MHLKPQRHRLIFSRPPSLVLISLRARNSQLQRTTLARFMAGFTWTPSCEELCAIGVAIVIAPVQGAWLELTSLALRG